MFCKIIAEELSLMTLESVQILKKNWIRGFRYDMRNLVNFHQITQKSENLFSMSSFCPKYARSELQKYRGVIFHDTEEWCKIWINPELVVLKMAWGIWWTFIRAPKNLKIFYWWALFCPRYTVSVRKFQRNYVSRHWRML